MSKTLANKKIIPPYQAPMPSNTILPSSTQPTKPAKPQQKKRAQTPTNQPNIGSSNQSSHDNDVSHALIRFNDRLEEMLNRQEAMTDSLSSSINTLVSIVQTNAARPPLDELSQKALSQCNIDLNANYVSIYQYPLNLLLSNILLKFR